MANPKYPLSAPENLEDNLTELFERITITPEISNKAGNFHAEIQTLDFTADTDATFQHLLGRLPNGYIVLSKSAYCHVKFISKSDSHLTLMADADATITVLIL